MVIANPEMGPCALFDEEEEMVDIVCTIKTIRGQLNPMDPGMLAKESVMDLSLPVRFGTDRVAT